MIYQAFSLAFSAARVAIDSKQLSTTSEPRACSVP